MVEYRIKIMKIHLNNKQTKYRINSSKIKKVINLLCLNLDLNKRKWSDISVIIVNERKFNLFIINILIKMKLLM